jgi:TonB family protein
MAAPLRSANSGPQKSVQFAHFGVLDAGTQSKGSMLVSVCVNAIAGLVIIVLSAAAAKQAIQKNKMLTELVVPVVQKKPEPVKPKVTPPKIKLPEIAKVETPKIVMPKIKPPDPVKMPPIVKMEETKPIIAPVAPKRVIAVAAPVAVSLAHPQAASVPNHDAQPSAVGLGHPDSPINNLHGPAVAQVNMGQGFPGMNGANTGHGPPATKVVLGNGSPGSTTIKGNGVVAVAGIPHGDPNANGTGHVPSGQQVSLGGAPPPPAPKQVAATDVRANPTPTLIFKPKPAYTDEARQAHIEGVITVHIRVLPTGQVEVIGLANKLGHGLDEAAMRAAEGTKFKPATDASGRPVLWDGYVTVAFQLAG